MMENDDHEDHEGHKVGLDQGTDPFFRTALARRASNSKLVDSSTTANERSTLPTGGFPSQGSVSI